MTYMTIEQFRQIYDEWKQSGLSVQQYCENTGLSESRFYYWKAKLKAEMLPAACGSFIPVKMSGKPASYSARGARTSALCEVEYPNGVIVRVTSDMTLDQLRQDRGSSRAREFHPHPLTEPCVKVSPHTALHTQLFVHRHNLGV